MNCKECNEPITDTKKLWFYSVCRNCQEARMDRNLARVVRERLVDGKCVCPVCSQEKAVSEYYTLRGLPNLLKCIACCKAASRFYRARNLEKAREKDRLRSKIAQNWKTPKTIATTKAYQANNKERLYEKAKEWAAANPDKVAATRARNRAKRRANPHKYLTDVVRQRIRDNVRLKRRREADIFQTLGYTVEELREHLGRQFKKGMSWENIGKWHIDHIIPIAAYYYDSYDHPDFRACWHLQNLQPCWAWENMTRSSATNVERTRFKLMETKGRYDGNHG